jgi:hypothetical protein
MKPAGPLTPPDRDVKTNDLHADFLLRLISRCDLHLATGLSPMKLGSHTKNDHGLNLYGRCIKNKTY